jgi:hypothetical protein
MTTKKKSAAGKEANEPTPKKKSTRGKKQSDQMPAVETAIAPAGVVESQPSPVIDASSTGENNGHGSREGLLTAVALTAGRTAGRVARATNRAVSSVRVIAKKVRRRS